MLSSRRGFTLIEVLIVVTLSIMLMLTASALFLTFLVGGARSTNSQLVKNEGKYALSQIEFLLRNSLLILPNANSQTCEASMDEIVLKGYDNSTTRLFKELDSTDNKYKIASNSGVYLTSGSVDIVSGPTFSCTKSDDGVSQYVSVTFILRKGNPTTDQSRDIITQTFQTSANIRSF